MIDWSSITGFQWDAANATKSHDKHGIGCPEAESVFLASDLRILEDPQHTTPAERRWHAFGTSASDSTSPARLSSMLAIISCSRATAMARRPSALARATRVSASA